MLTDPKSNRIRGVVKLQKKDARSSTGLFLLEGLQGLKEALDHPQLVQEVFATPNAIEQSGDIFARLASHGVEITEVDDRVLSTLSTTETPQGVVAVCQQIDVELSKVGQPLLVAYLANIRDPGNAGTILRVADAANADAVIFSDNSVDLYNPKVVRSTTGSIFHLNVTIDASLDSVIDFARMHQLQILAADAGGDALDEIAPEVLAKPTLWIFGNEAWGFEDGVLDRVDRVVSVPIFGKAESLNLATAASICLYASAMAQNR